MPNGPVVYGNFNPDTYIFDTSEIYEVEMPEELKQLWVKLYLNMNRVLSSLNGKEAARYDNTSPFVMGQTWFPNPNIANSTQVVSDFRQAYRTVVNFGALPNTGTTSQPHFIPCNAGTTFTRIYGATSDTTGLTYLPLPFVSTTGDHIQLTVDATNVNITTLSNRTNYNVTYVVLEYLFY